DAREGAGGEGGEGGGEEGPGHHRFTKAPGRFDQAFIGAGNRILGKHDPGARGIEKRLDDDANARSSEASNTLAVRNGRVRVCRPPDLADGAWDICRRMDVEHGEVLTGEARRRAVFV